MNQTYYFVAFLMSMILTGAYVFMWQKKFDVHITLCFALIPVVNLGYMLQADSKTIEMALGATKISYLGGCFLQMIITLAVFSLCQIKLDRWIRILFMLASSAVYFPVLTIGSNNWFYKSYHMEETGSGYILIKEYGIMHTVMYLLIVFYFILSFGAIIYAFLRKNLVSRRVLILLFMPIIICMICVFITKNIDLEVELIPVAYILAQIVYLRIVYRISLYDVTETAIETLAQTGSTGIISFDRHMNYLGSNETARKILPELVDLKVDLSLNRNQKLHDLIYPWLTDFEEHPGNNTANRHFYERDDRIYLFKTEKLPGKKREKGYAIFITDDTLDRAYIKLLDDYNSNLEKQVKEKTADIIKMHDNLILGMATMVESRDNSTGGHIKRTREGVRILIDTMRDMEQLPEEYKLDDALCRNIVKAAPMHDLGKIAVDDKILRKPGSFTEVEFEEMKNHASQGARIVHEILKETDDDEFHAVAVNVAKYHHERWDGTGYPEGLKGSQIPLEARIMAIADVYDAMVSKRVYKDSMSFEEADALIRKGMGSQFDPVLLEVYLKAKQTLESYYKEQ